MTHLRNMVINGVSLSCNCSCFCSYHVFIVTIIRSTSLTVARASITTDLTMTGGPFPTLARNLKKGHGFSGIPVSRG